jgi:D-lactate dehydrogenase
MKIFVFEAETWEAGSFEGLQRNHEIIISEDVLTPESAAELTDADIISTFIYSKLQRETLKQLKALKLIATRSTGFDHIDLDYCRENGITICNVPSYGAATVAEHVFGLLLTISHNLTEAIDRTRRGEFSFKGLRGFDLEGKTLGVVGTGDIGRRVIGIAHGFGMEVLAHDTRTDEKLAAQLSFDYVDRNTLLRKSDIVTLHVPATKATHHLLGPEEFGMMKTGSVLINTSRGSVVDIHALLRALADGKLRAVGLDVIPEEPVIREEAELLRSVFRREHNLETLLIDHVLLRMRNVYITPHSAFNTKEAVQEILSTTVENIRAFADGKPQNVIAE